MKLTIKAKECLQLPDGRWQLLTDCESLKEALDAHSPNIVVEYLNDNYGPLQTSPVRGGFKIAHIAPPSGGWWAGRKEAGNGKV